MLGVGFSSFCVLSVLIVSFLFCFFFKQKTAYEMRISDWSSDVCSSDLLKKLSMTKRGLVLFVGATGTGKSTSLASMIGYRNKNSSEIGRASCRERVCQYV